MNALLRIGLLTVSDRASQGIYEDQGGPAMSAWLKKVLLNEIEFCTRIVPDEIDQITDALGFFTAQGCSLILTTGGTGPAVRDVTPEATAIFCDRILDGFGEEMRRASLKVVPTAILSRQIAGTKGQSLIINLPGKPSAIADCLDAIFAAVPYCIDLLEGPSFQTDPAVFECFRPKAKKGQ